MRVPALARAALAACAALAAGCAAPAPVPGPAGAPVRLPETVDASIASADGTPIRYHTSGRGAPALVFVHGWSLDQGCWAEQVTRFSPGRQVITLDLAGHGESGRGRREWTLASLGEDVRAVVEAIGPRRVVLVGHSMGGYVALEACRLMPGRVAGIVGVDAFQDVEPPAGAAAAKAEMLAELDRDFPAGARRLAGALLPRAPDPALKERIEAQFAAALPEIALPLLRAAWSYDLAAALGRVRVPVRDLETTSLTNVAAARRHCSDFTVIDLTAAGLGHFPMLENPALFDDKLEAALNGFR
jgi:pimeloyl-ACP methyl ester carboxylesterase